MPSDPVLVTGGTGVVGRPLVERLVADGRDVRALARTQAASDALETLGARPVRGDVLDPASLQAAVRGCGTVFHVAGMNAMCLSDPQPMYRTNIEGSENVVRAAVLEGVGRVVYTSSASAIGEERGTIGSEDSPHRGRYLSHYERAKHTAERRVLTLAGDIGVDLVCVNPSSVQGPGRSTGSARLLVDLVKGRLPFLVETTVSLVDIRDCTEGHVLAEERGTALERYVLSGATVTTRDAVELIRRIWGRPKRIWWIPPSVAITGGTVVELAGTILRRDVPVCHETARTLLHGHRYDGSKAERELGLRYTPLEETLERTLSWLAERGLVPPRATPEREAGT
ncbi:MAG: NAD-dependent epimerase/dehydratase family protein [Actinomycetota bacterium]